MGRIKSWYGLFICKYFYYTSQKQV